MSIPIVVAKEWGAVFVVIPSVETFARTSVVIVVRIQSDERTIKLDIRLLVPLPPTTEPRYVGLYAAVEARGC